MTDAVATVNKGRFAGYDTYEQYLASPHWIALHASFCRQPARCYGCGRDRRLQLHHVSYDSLGHELPSDFVVVCRKCHKRIHRCLASRFRSLRLGEQVKKTAEIFPDLFKIEMEEARDHNDHAGRWDRHCNPKPPIVLKSKGQKKKKQKSTLKKAGFRRRLSYENLPVSWKNSQLKPPSATAAKARKTPFKVYKAKQADDKSANLAPPVGAALADVVRQRIRAASSPAP